MKELKNQILQLIISACFVFLISFSVQAQTQLYGTVLDVYTELPVQSFSIGTNDSFSTFSGGTFKLDIQKLPAQLFIKANGYYSVRVHVSDYSNPIRIHLIPENINIREITVHAFQSGQRLTDTPGSIGMITNRQVLAEPTFTLAPTVNRIPGVWMQSGSMNTNRLTIRGIGSRSPYSSNKIRAYFGDIPLTNGVGETTLEDLDLEQISNIEIIKGPSSGFYGSGLGGVLLFSPLKQTQNQFSQRVSVGSYQTLKYSGKLSLGNEKSNHSLVYSRIHSDGYRENNETNRHNLSWTTSITKNRTKIDILASFIKMNAFIPSSVDLKTFRETPEEAAANWAAAKGYEDYTRAFAGISLLQDLAQNWQVKISGFGSYNKNNELRPFNILQEKNHYLGLRPVLEKKYISGNNTYRLIFGDEYFNENYSWKTLQNKNRTAGDLLSDNREFRWYNNLFILTDLNIQEKMTVSASLNWNQTNYNYFDQFLADGDQSGKHKFEAVISPRLATSFSASEKVRLFMVVSHGFSPPTLEETLMPNGQRNTSVKPETGWNFEVGTKAAFGTRLQLEISAYYMMVKNLLVARRTGEDAFMGINAGATSHPGLELNLGYKLIGRPEWTSYFRMNANLTRYRFDDFNDNGTDYSGNKLTGTPATTSNWMLETTHAKGYFMNLHFQTVGRIPVRDDNALFSDAYQLLNLMAGYEKTFSNFSVSVSSGIQNLNNTSYASMLLINASATGNNSPRYYYPGLPRNFKSILSLSYRF